MGQISNTATAYICPIHGGVRQSSTGKCPECDIVLVQENIHFAQSRHMADSWSPLAIVGALMTLAVAVMMFMR